MATQVSICNLALHRLGCERISSISAQNKRAVLLNDIYDDALKEVLEMHPWTFALKRATLSNTGVEPEFEYSYQFTIPADYVRLVKEYNDNDVKIESTFLSDADELDIIYVYFNQTPSTYSALFINLLALTLASKASYSLIQDKELREQLKQEVKAAREEASFTLSQADLRQDLKINTFTASRL